MARTRRRMGWRLGIPMVLLAMAIGWLTGWTIDRATAAPAPAQHAPTYVAPTS